MNDNININDSHLNPSMTFRRLCFLHMQQLTNFPYIEKDFDALTDYELLCLVVKYLNDVINNSNKQNESITNLYNAFLELQTYMNESVQELEDAFNQLNDYVRDYFDNLDVQEEINNKLDEMLEDGVLEQIIEQFIQSTAIWCFDTVADMKAATNLINGSYAKTLGYYAVNDGGGGIYKITNILSTNEFQEEIGDLYATLIINPIMNSLQFGINSTIDSTSILQKAINVCISKKASLKLLTNINLNTLSENIITINGNIEIDGCNNTIYNNVSGDYHALFLIAGSVNIKNVIIENDENNVPTENTGTDEYDRVDFYLRECYNSLFENITINNCIGVWQFICIRCNNTIIKNNIINYNELYDLQYDRTSIYLNGFNIQCQNNILNGKQKARTGIESHGDNILVENNEIKNYINAIYIVNDYTENKIHNVNILNNYCYVERGLSVWLTETNKSIDTINILNNTIITTGDWYSFYLYDVLGENFTVNNINFKNNVIKHLNTSSTKEGIRIAPSRIGENKNVIIKNISIENNDINEKATSYAINLLGQTDGFNINNIFINNNIFDLNEYILLHYVSTSGLINNVTFNNNIIKNNGTALLNVSASSIINGLIKICNNEVEKELENIVNGTSQYNCYVVGTYPINLLTRDLHSYYFVNVHDLNGNKIETRNGVNNYTLYNDTVLTGPRFKKGDIIWNNNPVIGTPIGWISISNDNFRIIQNILGGV